jgi:hypothetical protein
VGSTKSEGYRTKSVNRHRCWPEWVHVNIGDDDCQTCYRGITPGVGDSIKIDKNGPSIDGDKIRQCYKVTEISSDNPMGANVVCPCSASPGTQECIKMSCPEIKAIAPGSGCNQCGNYDKYNITQALIRSLSSMGWGENIGGFRVTAWQGTLEKTGTVPYTEDVWIERMVASGHFTRGRQSLPTGAGHMRRDGEAAFAFGSGSPAPYADRLKLFYILDVQTANTVTFVDRWRQTIEMSARAAEPGENGEDGVIWKLTNAWPPEYLEMFIERTQYSAASLTLGGSAGNNFECGVVFSGVTETTTTEGSSFGTETESATLTARAYVTQKNLIKIVQHGEGWDNALADDGILEDVLHIGFNFGSYSRSSTLKDFKSEVYDGETEGPEAIDVMGDSTLFQVFEMTAKYDIKFTNGWDLSVDFGTVVDASGIAKEVNPTYSVSKTFMKDQLFFCISVSQGGGGTAGIAFTPSNPIFVPETETAPWYPHTINYHCGIVVDEAGTLGPSLSFHGKVGNPSQEGFKHILAGFEWDVNMLEGTARIGRSTNLTRFNDDQGNIIGSVDFRIQGQFNDPTATIFDLGIDGWYENTIVEFGETWGSLVFKGQFMAGVKAGQPPEGGMGDPGTEAGLYGQCGITWYNGILSWLGFPFDVNPGIGLSFGAKFVFNAKSTYGGVGSGFQTFVGMGPISWNISPADSLRHHLSRQHRSFFNSVPLVGCILGRAPIGKRIGKPEPIVTYLIRASVVRAHAALAESVSEAQQAQETQLQNIKDKNNIFFKGIGVPNTVQEQREHNFCYNPCQEGIQNEEPGTAIYQAQCKSADTCKGLKKGETKTTLTGEWTNRGPNDLQPPEDATFWASGNKKDCDSYNCKGTLTGSGDKNEGCYHAGKEAKNYYDYDRWLQLPSNNLCKVIKRKYRAKVASSWKAFDTSRFSELRGTQGLIATIIELLHEFVWQKVFLECWMNKSWSQDMLTGAMADAIIDTMYGAYFDSGITNTGHVILLKDGDLEQVVIKEEDGVDADDSPVSWGTMKPYVKSAILGGNDKSSCAEACDNLQLCKVKDYLFNKVGECYNELCFQGRGGCGGDGGGDDPSRESCQASFFNWWIYKNVYKNQIYAWWTQVRACQLEKIPCAQVSNSKFALHGAYRTVMLCSMQSGSKYVQGDDGSLSGQCDNCNQHFFWFLHHQIYGCSSCLAAIAAARMLLDTADLGILALQKECCKVGPGEEGYEKDDDDCNTPEGDEGGEQFDIFLPDEKTGKCYREHKYWEGDNVMVGGDPTSGDESMADCQAVSALKPGTDEDGYLWSQQPHTLVKSLTADANAEYNIEMMRITFLETYIRNLSGTGSPNLISIAMSDPFWVEQPTNNPSPSPIFIDGVTGWGPDKPAGSSGESEGWWRRWDDKTFDYDWTRVFAINTARGGFTSGFHMQKKWWECSDALMSCCANMDEAIADWNKLAELKDLCDKSVTMGNPAAGGFNWDAAKTITCSDIPLMNFTFKNIFAQRMIASKEMVNSADPNGTFGAIAWANNIYFADGAQGATGEVSSERIGISPKVRGANLPSGAITQGFYMDADSFPALIKALHFNNIKSNHGNQAAAKTQRVKTLWAAWTLFQGGNPDAEGFGCNPIMQDVYANGEYPTLDLGLVEPGLKIKYRQCAGCKGKMNAEQTHFVIWSLYADELFEMADYGKLATFVNLYGYGSLEYDQVDTAGGDAESQKYIAAQLYYGAQWRLTSGTDGSSMYSKISAPNTYPSFAWVTGNSAGDINFPTSFEQNEAAIRQILSGPDGAAGIMTIPGLNLSVGEKDRLATVTMCKGKQLANPSGTTSVTSAMESFPSTMTGEELLASAQGMTPRKGAANLRTLTMNNSSITNYASASTGEGYKSAQQTRVRGSATKMSVAGDNMVEGIAEFQPDGGTAGDPTVYTAGKNPVSSQGQRGGSNGTRGHGAGSNNLKVSNTAGGEQHMAKGSRNDSHLSQGSGTAETDPNSQSLGKNMDDTEYS